MKVWGGGLSLAGRGCGLGNPRGTLHRGGDYETKPCAIGSCWLCRACLALKSVGGYEKQFGMSGTGVHEGKNLMKQVRVRSGRAFSDIHRDLKFILGCYKRKNEGLI